MPKVQALTVWLIAACLAVPAATHADPVLVTGGGYTPDFEGHLFRFTGDGFDLVQNELLFFPDWDSGICRICHPGDPVDLSAHFDGTAGFGSGSGTIGGTTYAALTYQGSLDFRVTPVVFPTPDDTFVSLTAPFVFTGFLRAFAGGREVFAEELRGQGSANAFFTGDSLEMRPEESEPRFHFTAAAPVPEPGTMVLVALGAFAAVARRRILNR
jgi:hypothetical protein